MLLNEMDILLIIEKIVNSVKLFKWYMKRNMRKSVFAYFF